ncbi:hypothetical protein V6N13_020203 [Hibiscus sabdariffa]
MVVRDKGIVQETVVFDDNMNDSISNMCKDDNQSFPMEKADLKKSVSYVDIVSRTATIDDKAPVSGGSGNYDVIVMEDDYID